MGALCTTSALCAHVSVLMSLCLCLSVSACVLMSLCSCRCVLPTQGFYLKNAQFMSTLSDDFVPPQYMKWMVKCQDAVPTPFAPGGARKVVEASLGKPIEEIFSSWEDEPMGAASIGQVHRAVLKNGRRVVVKVQYPGIEHMFRSDITTTIQFCKLAMTQHVRSATHLAVPKWFGTSAYACSVSVFVHLPAKPAALCS